ncbi:MAG: hypothetical protein KBS59_05915 [Clostridiales bacterium]|nr:hypothetical protein [Clostridiales bacterium]
MKMMTEKEKIKKVANIAAWVLMLNEKTDETGIFYNFYIDGADSKEHYETVNVVKFFSVERFGFALTENDIHIERYEDDEGILRLEEYIKAEAKGLEEIKNEQDGGTA